MFVALYCLKMVVKVEYYKYEMYGGENIKILSKTLRTETLEFSAGTNWVTNCWALHMEKTTNRILYFVVFLGFWFKFKGKNFFFRVNEI